MRTNPKCKRKDKDIQRLSVVSTAAVVDGCGTVAVMFIVIVEL